MRQICVCFQFHKPCYVLLLPHINLLGASHDNFGLSQKAHPAFGVVFPENDPEGFRHALIVGRFQFVHFVCIKLKFDFKISLCFF